MGLSLSIKNAMTLVALRPHKMEFVCVEERALLYNKRDRIVLVIKK